MSTFSQGDLIDTERESMGYSPGMLTRRLCDEIDRVRVQRDALVAERDRLREVADLANQYVTAKGDPWAFPRWSADDTRALVLTKLTAALAGMFPQC
jgi:hypothetical protein